MNLKEFLAQALPEEGQGNYFVESHSKINNFHRQSGPLKTFEEIASVVDRLSKKNVDIYVAVGSFDGKRNNDSAKFKRSHYADLDCGEGKPYKTKAEALKHAVKLSAAGRIPKPSLIVDSGRGIHLYWSLEANVPVEDWRKAAVALKEGLLEAGLHIDLAPTADAARIMRVPGTMNVKDPAHPALCSVLRNFGLLYSQNKLIGHWGEHTKPSLKLATVDGKRVGAPVDNTDLSAGIEKGWFNDATVDERLEHAKKMLAHIPDETRDDYMGWLRIGRTLQDASGGDREQEWFDLWTTWSSGSPNYSNEADCLDKWNNQFPTMQNISVGTLIHLAQQGGFSITNTKHAVDYPPGYSATGFGTIKTVDGDKHVLVAEYHFKDVRVSGTLNDSMMFSAKVFDPKGYPVGDLDTTLALVNRSVDKEFYNDLSRAGITLTSKNTAEEIAGLMKAFLSQLRDAREIGQMANHFGWQGGGGFALGTQVINQDGSSHPCITADKQLRSIYSPAGDIRTWQDTVQFILDQKRQEINLVIATAFAAPLVGFTGVSGILVSLAGAASGTGKSTALRAAQSVWGSPKRGVNALNDTSNSVSKKLETLRNLPAYWDELRMHDTVLDFVRMVFVLSQGKGKQRLTSSSELQHTGEWETLITVASNEPLRGTIEELAGNTDAGTMRLFEMDAPGLVTGGQVAEAMIKFAALDHHFGLAGVKYATWLATNRATAKTIVEKTSAVLSKHLNPRPEERFWLATISSLYAGAYIANKIGLLKFDLAAMRDMLLYQFREHRLRGVSMSGQFRSVNLLLDFVNHEKSSSVRTTKLAQALSGGKPPRMAYSWPLVGSPIRGGVSYQMTDTGDLVVSVKRFSAWMRKKKLPLAIALGDLQMLNVAVDRQFTLGAGTPYAAARQRCLVIDTSHKLLKGAFDDL